MDASPATARRIPGRPNAPGGPGCRPASCYMVGSDAASHHLTTARGLPASAGQGKRRYTAPRDPASYTRSGSTRVCEHTPLAAARCAKAHREEPVKHCPERPALAALPVLRDMRCRSCVQVRLHAASAVQLTSGSAAPQARICSPSEDSCPAGHPALTPCLCPAGAGTLPPSAGGR